MHGPNPVWLRHFAYTYWDPTAFRGEVWINGEEKMLRKMSERRGGSE